MTVAHLVQLPFPSTSEPDPELSAYYRTYDEVFGTVLPEFFVPEGQLWEIPLWVAHLTALLEEAGLESRFADLSRDTADATVCAGRLLAGTGPGELVLLSPLAQNFALAIEVSRQLTAQDRKVVLGGNMATLAPPENCFRVVRGQLTVEGARSLAGAVRGVSVTPRNRGLQQQRITWSPDYRHLGGYAGNVPLLRVNASHGCLYECGFCGDAWSSQLTLVEQDALRREVDELARRFPDCRTVYIGDKTFGQSREAVANLLAAFTDRRDYRFIVQTHVMQVRPWVVEAMLELGVVVVEMGFESADTRLLKAQNKLSRGLADYTERIDLLRTAGLKVVLNVMGGLDEETESSHRSTVDWLLEHPDLAWLCNLYNFVPYPLSPDFATLRPRIFDWDFAHWREDAPVVYTPTHLSVDRSWQLFKEKIAVAHDIARLHRPSGRPVPAGADR